MGESCAFVKESYRWVFLVPAMVTQHVHECSFFLDCFLCIHCMWLLQGEGYNDLPPSSCRGHAAPPLRGYLWCFQWNYDPVWLRGPQDDPRQRFHGFLLHICHLHHSLQCMHPQVRYYWSSSGKKNKRAVVIQLMSACIPFLGCCIADSQTACVSLWISCTTTKKWPNLFFFPLLGGSARFFAINTTRCGSSQWTEFGWLGFCPAVNLRSMFWCTCRSGISISERLNHKTILLR